MFSLFTTAKPVGVAVRDITIMLGSILTVLCILGVLTPEQAKELQAQVEAITGQLPALLTALGIVLAGGMSIYRTITKSLSDRAAAAAKAMDAKAAEGVPTDVKTPNGAIVASVPAK